MNLVMELLWIQVSFKCYDNIQIPYIEKTCWCMYGGIDACNVRTGLKNRNLWGGTLCDKGTKSQREKTTWWHRL